ncbi:MAG TPA: hypothetical protein PL045_11845 [Chitinophagaceae bacterium]|nr:hypothetical protein [Chitinophagaceae bacterium]
MCNKEPYTTRHTAVSAARGIAKDSHKSMKVYFCSICFVWHLSTCGQVKNKVRRQHTKLKYPLKIPPIKKDEDGNQ